MARQKQIDRIVSLLGVKFKVAQIRQEELLRKELLNLFKRFSNGLVQELSDSRILLSLANNSVFFRETFGTNPMFTIPAESEVNDFGRSQINRFMKPLIDLLNKRQDYRQIINKHNIKMYNMAGLGAAVSTIFQAKARTQKVKKAVGDDELFDFDINIESDFSSASVGDTNVDFFLQDEKILNAVEARSQNINFVTDLDYKIITNVMIQETYIKGSNTNAVTKALHESLGNVSENRAHLIARTEMNIIQGEADIEFGKRVGMKMKRWLSVGDHLVRTQHAENEIVGAVPFEDTFSDFTEYGPSQCALPYSCRCTLLLINDPSEDPVRSYWDGGNLVQEILD